MDPTILTSLFAFLPQPYRDYAADALGVAGMLSIAASAIAASVKPPSTNSAPWKQTLYSVVTWPALNLGWARNAVVPGMDPRIQQARLVEAQVLAAQPTAPLAPAAASVAVAVATR